MQERAHNQPETGNQIAVSNLIQEGKMKSKHFFSIILMSLFLLAIGASTGIAQSTIQTQYGPNEMEVDLLRAKVSGQVLSVVFSFRNTSTSSSVNVTYDIADVHFVDNSESKKYHVLKDEKGEWLSGPIDFVKRDIGGWKRIPVTKVYLPKNEKKIVWYKFPAPPENVTTIQINLPDISPFDDVEISR